MENKLIANNRKLYFIQVNLKGMQMDILNVDSVHINGFEPLNGRRLNHN